MEEIKAIIQAHMADEVQNSVNALVFGHRVSKLNLLNSLA